MRDRAGNWYLEVPLCVPGGTDLSIEDWCNQVLSALTGTPGTGKFIVARRLEVEGLKVTGDEGVAWRMGALVGCDGRTGTWEGNMELLVAAIPERRPLVLVGHSSHLLSLDLTIVLRCQPDMLRGRLGEGGWATAQVRDNVEAKALGVITQESIDRTRTWEIDTPHRTAEETADAVMGIVEGQTKGFGSRQVDWTGVILTWS